METAILGGGCFWCLEAVFEQLDGVESVLPGYCGGTVVSPTYMQVCDGDSGHIEVVQICYCPEIISFAELLDVFFSIHDPTTPDRQGHDVGSQYRSIIFTQSPRQEQDASKVISELNAEQLWTCPIVTVVLPARDFYPAEEYHRQYFRKNPDQGYCSVVINPKVAKFRKAYSQRLKAYYR